MVRKKQRQSKAPVTRGRKPRSAPHVVGTRPAPPPRNEVEAPAVHANEDHHTSVAYDGTPVTRAGEMAAVKVSVGPHTPGRAMFDTGLYLQAHQELFAADTESEAGAVDAWYGEYGTVVTRAKLREGLRDGTLMPEAIIGNDDRTLVTDTTKFPFRALCSLLITMPTGNKFVGTGWLAGPKTVITAGHCVHMRREGGWAKRIVVMPARNGNDKPYSYESTRFRSVTGWTQQRRPENDYGAILLQEPIGNTVGNIGYVSRSNAELQNALVNVVGYPGDKPGTMWGHVRTLKSFDVDQLFYDIDTYGGQSGAPVILWEGDSYQSVGIHNYGDVAGNTATRINDAVYDRISDWVAAGG